MFAAGLSLIFGIMRLVNIAHGDLIVLAAYLALVVIETFGLNPFAALLIVVPVMAALGYALQRFLLNRTLGAGPIEVATLAIADGLSIGVLPLIQFAAAVVVIGLLQILFYRTALGRAFRATSDDQPVARLMGLNDQPVFALAMALSLAVIAIAGVLLAIRT